MQAWGSPGRAFDGPTVLTIPLVQWAYAGALFVGLLALTAIAVWALRQRRAAQRHAAHLTAFLAASHEIRQQAAKATDPVSWLEGVCEALRRVPGYRDAGVVLLSAPSPADAERGEGVRTASGASDLPARSVVCMAPADLPPWAQEAIGDDGMVGGAPHADEAAAADTPPLPLLAEGEVVVAPLKEGARTRGLLLVTCDAGLASDDAERDRLRELGEELALGLCQHEARDRQRRAAPTRGPSRALFEEAPVGIFQATLDGRITALNQTMADIMGYDSPEEALEALARTDSLLGRDSLRRREVITQLQRVGEIHDVEAETRTKGGQPRWLLINACQQPWGDNGDMRMVGFARDITERKAAEAALQASQRALATLMSNLPGMAYQCLNDDAWTMLFVSEGCRALTGYTAADLMENNRIAYRDLIMPEDRARVWLSVQEAVERQVPFELEYRIRTASGDVRWVWEQGREVASGDETAAILEGLVLDVTPAKRMEAEGAALLDRIREQAGTLQAQAARVQEQASQVDQIMKTVPEGVILLDADGTIIHANPAAWRDLALLSDAVADALVGATGAGGSGDGEGMPTPPASPVKLTRLGDRPLAELLTSPPTAGLWHELRAKSRGATRVFEALAQPVERGPTPEGWVMVLKDVTQEREVQQRIQQQERLAALGQMAAGIAHDFNNITAVIVLYSQLALRTAGLPGKVREQLEIIAREAERAGDLIQQILDFGRRGVLQRQPMDLSSFLNEQARLLERTLPESIRLELSWERPEDGAGDTAPGAYFVNGDPSRLRQVVLNLVVNARDAMPEGGKLRLGLRRITVEDRRDAPLPDMAPGDWIHLSVADSGTGIPPDVLPHIFEPFFTTKGSGGSGLGLPQVHGIVAQHDGLIDVDTAPGEGTTVHVYLPALPVDPWSSHDDASCGLPVGAGELVMVVEDNAVVRRTLVEALENRGYRIIATANGRQALETLEQRTTEDQAGAGTVPDVALILCDLVMPEMGGQALYHAVRERGWHVPVVMLSGHPARDELDALKAEGLAGWLPKPPELDELTALVAGAIAQSHPC